MAEKSKTKSKSLIKKVQFEFPAPEAKEVCLAGDFNNCVLFVHIDKFGESRYDFVNSRTNYRGF